MTSRYERMKMQRRMQRRIQLVVEERRIALGAVPRVPADQVFEPERPAFDPERTIEIPPLAAVRAIGRVAIEAS